MTKWNTKVWNYIMNNQRNMPPLHWLKAFEVSARTLSFTQAAEELLITQSAVSNLMRVLTSLTATAPRGRSRASGYG